jgi:pimeloyl-ACP methyl ester carboxylesterase
MKVKRHYVNINGLKISYLEAGEGQPLILVHGIFYSAGLNYFLDKRPY